MCFCCLFLYIFWQTSQKQKQKTTSSDPWRGTQERLDSRHRSELFVFFDTCWSKFLVFSLCVYCFQKLFFICYCLHSTILTKACVSTIYTTPPPMATPSVYIHMHCIYKYTTSISPVLSGRSCESVSSSNLSGGALPSSLLTAHRCDYASATLSGTIEPQPPALDRSGALPTSTASDRPQWTPPGLSQGWITVDTTRTAGAVERMPGLSRIYAKYVAGRVSQHMANRMPEVLPHRVPHAR